MGTFHFRRHTGIMTSNEAYAYCRQIATSHYENFPVASVIVPSRMRRHLYAIYAFSRKADDIADEGNTTVEARMQQLRELRQQLRLEYSNDPLFCALLSTIKECRLPLSLFDRLLDAFESDVNFTPPTSWDQVLSYCHNSADPVGELFLRLDYGNDEPPLDAITASDRICTALQITNFLQDLSIDKARGREYLPMSDAEVIQRTRQLFEEGARVIRYVRSWRLRMELRAIIYGGRTMLELCARRKDRLTRPRLNMLTLLLHLFRTR